MYPIIWVNWVLVDLFIKTYQNLRFSSRDRSFFLIRECARDQCQKYIGLNKPRSSAMRQEVALTTFSVWSVQVKNLNGVTENASSGQLWSYGYLTNLSAQIRM